MSIPSRLQEIVAHKRREVDERKAVRPTISVADAPPVRDFTAALHRDTVALIAEVKMASPSKGVMRENFDPLDLARTYAENGAACISVLTDERFFRGHDRYLSQIREVVNVPLLRKEFIIDEWQIGESRALGADAILLIVAILTPQQIASYQAAAQALGMSVLVETHTEEELRVALEVGCPLIGVNNRNLHTFETTLETTERLASLIPADAGTLLVSESAIFTAADVARVAKTGARAVLVGEALVREGVVAAKVRELAGVPNVA
ncbi:MAG: indole-3-glycerol phosphate synthase TrpC [Actinomycetota bacterium]